MKCIIQLNKFWRVITIIIAFSSVAYISYIDIISIIHGELNILLLLLNSIALYFLYIILNLKFILIVNENSISYKLIPINRNFKYIYKKYIKNIQINSGTNLFHIGITFTGYWVINMDNGESIKIHTVYGRKYLLSTGLNKDDLIQVLNKYGYPVIS